MSSTRLHLKIVAHSTDAFCFVGAKDFQFEELSIAHARRRPVQSAAKLVSSIFATPGARRIRVHAGRQGLVIDIAIDCGGDPSSDASNSAVHLASLP
jgi:hypothetical protein